MYYFLHIASLGSFLKDLVEIHLQDCYTIPVRYLLYISIQAFGYSPVGLAVDRFNVSQNYEHILVGFS